MISLTGICVNLTQHLATPEQIADGVRDLPPSVRVALIEALTFTEPPAPDEIADRADYIAEIAICNGLGPDDGDDPIPVSAMIGGAGYLLPALERELRRRGVRPQHSFTRRETVEAAGADGSVTKTSVFRHVGWTTTE